MAANRVASVELGGPPGSRALRLALRLAAFSDSVVVLLLGRAGEAGVNQRALTENAIQLIAACA